MFEKIPEDSRSNIEVVSGDGAKWIRASMKNYLPNAKFCIDPFHVVEWTNECLKKVRISESREAKLELKYLQNEKKELLKEIEKCKKDGATPKYHQLNNSLNVLDTAIDRMKENIDAINGGLYPLCKNPEHLTEKQTEKLNRILKEFPNVKKAYNRKEELRDILKLDDVQQAEVELKAWERRAKNSNLEPFVYLSEKISRHHNNIKNTIKYGVTNARIEAKNNNIKGIIRCGRGFRNIDNLMGLVEFNGTIKLNSLITNSGYGNWRKATLL